MSCGVPQSGGMGEHAQGDAVSTDDPAAVQADDELLDNLGAGQVPDGDPLTTELAAWRADIVEDERPTAGELARIIADRLTGNEIIPGAWVILRAVPGDDAIALTVVTWGPPGASARAEARYVLQLTEESPPAP